MRSFFNLLITAAILCGLGYAAYVTPGVRNELIKIIYGVKFIVSPQLPDMCAAKATHIGRGKKLGLCEISMKDHVGEALIYDETDMIANGQNLAARTPNILAMFPDAWRTAYKSFGTSLKLPDLAGDHAYTTVRIKSDQHFYYMRWE